jgi:acyl-CoA dehydrogenase
VSALIDRARSFARGAAAEIEAQADEAAAARAALRCLGEEGLLALTVPAANGDATTVSVLSLCEVREALAYESGMLDVMFVMQGLGSFPVALGGDESQRGDLLRVGRGELVAAFALTEPDAGSDLSAVATRATRTADGWRLDGHKTFISNAPICDRVTVLARTGGEPGSSDGLSMFLVPGDAKGLRREAFEVIAPHPIGDLFFDGVELPGGALLGEEGRGLDLALATLARFRTSVAAAACGFAARALDESARHLMVRKQFGHPLAKFQGLRFDLAEMDTRLAAARLLVREAAKLVDAGEPARAEVARAKLFATEAASWICDRAVQHFGGRGVRRGEVVERLFREVRALRIYEGTSEVQRLILAKELLGRMGASGLEGPR